MRLDEFRIYYNKTIHPELVRLERRRQRLLRLLFSSGLLLSAVVVFELYLGIPVLTLVLMAPIALYIGYLVYRIRQFVQTFKPQVMNLVLDFIDDGPNRGELSYEPKRSLGKDRFQASRIFAGRSTPYFEGEDFIAGRVGQMDFELCELDVREISKVINRLNTVFKGIFLQAGFPEETEGEIIVWPRHLRQYIMRSIREFTWQGGQNVDHEIMNDAFREKFLTFATPDTVVASVLTEPMQEAIVRYANQTGKDIYASFFDEELFIAVSEEKDLLEPYILQSNLSFELVREFFEDVNLLLEIIEEFDKTH